MAVLRQVRRLLRDSGALWLNLGDSFSKHVGQGAPRGSLLLVPQRLALALSADGWITRNVCAWAKPNSLPSSAKDRLSPTYETIIFATKSRRYFFDLDAIRIPHRSAERIGTRRPIERARQEPRRRVDRADRHRPARPSGDLPRGVDRAADPRHLPGADLRAVRPRLRPANPDRQPQDERGDAAYTRGRGTSPLRLLRAHSQGGRPRSILRAQHNRPRRGAAEPRLARRRTEPDLHQAGRRPAPLRAEGRMSRWTASRRAGEVLPARRKSHPLTKEVWDE